MKRTQIVVAAVAVVVVAGGAWFWFGRGSGLVAGPGAFGAELADCQDRVYGDNRMPSYIEFVGGTVWHQGTTAELRIGGKVKLMGPAGKAVAYDYECLARNGHVLSSRML